MRVAIPSYKRPQALRTKTLAYLLRSGFDPGEVDVFVADEEERREYEEELRGIGVNIIVGSPTLRAQRNFIDFYYPINSKILCLDDDIDGIYLKKNDKEVREVPDLKKIAQIGFAECVKNNTAIWGVSAVMNPFYMSHNISTNLKYLEGAVFGIIITHDKNLSVTIEDKEDFERSILYFHKYRKVVRLNMISMKTNFYTEPGGMQMTRTEERVNQSALYLSKRWPQYCKLNLKKKSGHAEVKLNSRAV